MTECTVPAGAVMHAGAAQGGISVLPSQYPPVYRDNVTDDFFGTIVADPYRWLENTDSPETLACELLQHSCNVAIAGQAWNARAARFCEPTCQPLLCLRWRLSHLWRMS